MSARRPLLTATAAGAVLFALWFVPSANATVDSGHSGPSAQEQQARQDQQVRRQDQGEAGPQSAAAGAKGLRLADTGSVDTTPYVLGGTGFLGFGAALVTVASRRSREATAV